jgi:hypothetical protein
MSMKFYCRCDHSLVFSKKKVEDFDENPLIKPLIKPKNIKCFRKILVINIYHAHCRCFLDTRDLHVLEVDIHAAEAISQGVVGDILRCDFTVSEQGLQIRASLEDVIVDRVGEIVRGREIAQRSPCRTRADKTHHTRSCQVLDSWNNFSHSSRYTCEIYPDSGNL